MMAQINNERLNNKDEARAMVEVVNGQPALVLKAGRTSNIILKWDANLENKLDSLVTAPWGNAIKMKDLEGYNVEIARANVNSNVGLMFTSGTKCVAITEDELKRLR